MRTLSIPSSVLGLSCIIALAFAGACGPNIPDRNDTNGDTGSGLEPTWSNVEETFQQRCVACHASGSSLLDLEGDELYDRIVGVTSSQVSALTLIQPSDPDASYLYLKITAMQAQACIDAGVPVAECGTQMPPPPDPQLALERRLTIRNWIAQGAEQEH